MGATESLPAVAWVALAALLSSARDAPAQNLEDYFARVCVPGVGCFEGALPSVDLDRQFQSPIQLGELSGQVAVSGIASGIGPLARVIGEVSTTASQDYPASAAHDAGTNEASARVVYSVQLTKNANFTLKTGFAPLPLAAHVETSVSGNGSAIATASVQTSLRTLPSFSAPFLTIRSQDCQNLSPGLSCNPSRPAPSRSSDGACRAEPQ